MIKIPILNLIHIIKMKILLTRAVVVMALLWAAVAVRPPSALCRASPLPSLIPIQVGEELRFDL